MLFVTGATVSMNISAADDDFDNLYRGCASSFIKPVSSVMHSNETFSFASPRPCEETSLNASSFMSSPHRCANETKGTRSVAPCAESSLNTCSVASPRLHAETSRVSSDNQSCSRTFLSKDRAANTRQRCRTAVVDSENTEDETDDMFSGSQEEEDEGGKKTEVNLLLLILLLLLIRFVTLVKFMHKLSFLHKISSHILLILLPCMCPPFVWTCDQCNILPRTAFVC